MQVEYIPASAVGLVSDARYSEDPTTVEGKLHLSSLSLGGIEPAIGRLGSLLKFRFHFWVTRSGVRPDRLPLCDAHASGSWTTLGKELQNWPTALCFCCEAVSASVLAWGPCSTFFFYLIFQGYSRLQVFPLLCSLKQALKSPQVSSPQHQARIQKGLLVTSYFIPQSDSLLSIEGGGSYFRSTICLSALPWPQTCAPPPLLLPLRAPWTPRPWISLGEKGGARQIQSLQRSPPLSPTSAPPSWLRNARFDWTNNSN